jgi:hypothetical protein
MTRTSVLRLVVSVGVVVAPLSAIAAKLEPPSVILAKPTTSVAVVEFKEITGPQMVFSVKQQLSGEPPAPPEIGVAVPAELAQWVAPNVPYVIAYTAYATSSALPGQTIVNPRGAQLLVTPGLAPAIFLDNDATRAVLAIKPVPHDSPLEKHLPALLALLDSPDVQIQSFGVAEIALRVANEATLTHAARSRLLRYAGNHDGHPGARALLLEGAGTYAAEYGRSGWADVARDVLATTPTTLRQSPEGEVVLAAFQLLEQRNERIPADVLRRWLAGDNAGFAEKALLALRRTMPDRESVFLAETLRLSLLPQATRAFLVDHQRRLEIMRSQLAQPKS